MHETEKGAYRCKEFADKFSGIVSEDVYLGAVRNESMINENIYIVHDGCPGHWNSSTQLWISFSSDKYVLSTLCCFDKLYSKIHCDKF